MKNSHVVDYENFDLASTKIFPISYRTLSKIETGHIFDAEAFPALQTYLITIQKEKN